MKIKDYVFNENKEKNVGNAERIFSFVAGVWLFSKAFSGRNKLFKALLGSALVYRAGTGHCALYKAMGVDGTATHNRVVVDTDVIVNKPREEVYAYWRKLENLPLFMKHLQSVRELSDTHSVWTAKLPGMGTVEWKSEITSDVPNESIKWKSMPDSQIDNTGLVRFVNAGDLGTQIRVVMSYEAPAGNLGAGVGNLLTPALERLIRQDIKRFKEVMETGQLPMA